MADDSGLLEFTLDDNDDSVAKPTTVVAETSSQTTNPVDSETESRVDLVITNLLKKSLPATARALAQDYWKSVLISISTQEGEDSLGWRSAVKKLSNLVLFLENTTSQQYPNVNTKLLPALLEEMQSTITQYGYSDSVLADLIRGVKKRSDDVPEVMITPASSAPLDKTQAETTDFQDEPAQEADDVIDLAAAETAFEFEQESSEPEQADELEPLSFELPEDDLVEPEPEPEKPKSEPKAAANPDSDELPPLELDLSDYLDSKD